MGKIILNLGITMKFGARAISWVQLALRDRITKKSKYIPKRLLSKIQELEAQKASVTKILEVLGEKILSY
ncbi:hypothetical protein [Scytonema sp. NUACC26]|uniref:hypothetical protein n=1 Tax=Scytonema sp. NUACC26 TaxID=3140176 RepID=UPI0034DBD72C